MTKRHQVETQSRTHDVTQIYPKIQVFLLLAPWVVSPEPGYWYQYYYAIIKTWKYSYELYNKSKSKRLNESHRARTMKSSSRKMFIKICQRRNICQLEADFVYLYRKLYAAQTTAAFWLMCVCVSVQNALCIRMGRFIPIFRPLTTEFPHSYFIEFINANANCARADRT